MVTCIYDRSLLFTVHVFGSWLMAWGYSLSGAVQGYQIIYRGADLWEGSGRAEPLHGIRMNILTYIL